MSFKNFLDLRKKVNPQIKVVERIILQKRSLKSDLFLAFSVVLVASGVIWGISRADTFVESITRPQTKNFSAVGIVLNIDSTNLYIDQAKGTDDPSRSTYTFDLYTVTKIETNQYISISTSDIKPGDKVVVQGQEDGGNITIKRIISFGIVAPLAELTKEETSTTTPDVATSTKDSSVIPVEAGIQSENLSSASNIEPGFPGVPENDNSGTSTLAPQSTSTESISTSTGQATTTIIGAISNTVGDIVDTVKDAVQTVIDTVVGSSTKEVTTPTEPVTLPVVNPTPTPEAPSPDVKIE